MCSRHWRSLTGPIEFPLPDIKTKRHIFKIHTSKMACAEDVDLEEFVMAKDELSGADIKVSLVAALAAPTPFVPQSPALAYCLLPSFVG